MFRYNGSSHTARFYRSILRCSNMRLTSPCWLLVFVFSASFALAQDTGIAGNKDKAPSVKTPVLFNTPEADAVVAEVTTSTQATTLGISPSIVGRYIPNSRAMSLRSGLKSRYDAITIWDIFSDFRPTKKRESAHYRLSGRIGIMSHTRARECADRRLACLLS